MDPRQDFNLVDLESDSGCPSDTLSLEDMFPWSDHGDSYTEGSDLPRSPLLSDSGEEPRFVWPDFDDEDFPAVPAGPGPYVGVYHGIPAGEESSDEDDFGLSHEIPAGCAGYLWAPSPRSLEAEDDGAVVPGPSRRRDSDSAETDSAAVLSSGIPADLVGPVPDLCSSPPLEHELPWYQRSVYWESWYEDLMKDLDEEI